MRWTAAETVSRPPSHLALGTQSALSAYFRSALRKILPFMCPCSCMAFLR
jgi:hypothetical protein